MNILLLDASTNAEIISVKKGLEYYDSSEISPISHSKTIFTKIDTCLKQAGITIQEINMIAAGIGPGSFTGIRIAVTTARMLAQVLGIRIIPISSQFIFAISIDADEGNYIMPAFDAKKGRVFAALYIKRNSSIEEIIKPGDYYINNILDKTQPGAKIICAGDGSAKFREIIEQESETAVILENYLPSGISSLKYISELHEKGSLDISDYDKVVPDYSRKSDAEIAKDTTA